MTYYSHIETPLGRLLMVGTSKALTGLYFPDRQKIAADWVEDEAIFKKAKTELTEYFAGKRKSFDLPLEFVGTDFQKKVWQELLKIPYGKSTNYKSIAAAIGRPKAVRAVGTAIGNNPLCVIGPCHRVISSSGSLGGYAGGLDRKKQLLTLEGITF